ncbi:MAG TPA: hypothetical protein PLR18_01060 [bacterium]|nr:hypothetical protein [bacterium]
MPQKSSGYIILYSVIILGSVALATIVSLSYFLITESRSTSLYNQSLQARFLADSCAELGLLAIRDNLNFSGTNNFILEQGSCTYTVINSGGAVREIRAIATVEEVVRKVKAITNQLTPQIELASWQEVADF